tara:strand:+ start:900 stop:1766 length:867 start_codon:yes stop_codon:yes gene_type:complete
MTDRHKRRGGYSSVLGKAVIPGTEFIRDIAIEHLEKGQFQPRSTGFDLEALNDLSLSIKAEGVMQPIIVRKLAIDRYEIIAGERRWKAAKNAGLTVVPAVIRKISDQSAIAIGLIENIQREDLNPVEESRALLQLQDGFGYTQQEVADAVGKSRSAVTNLMRLASLEPAVQRQLEVGDIQLGHAKCLLGLTGDEQVTAGREVASQDLTVRQTEDLVKGILSPEEKQKRKKREHDPELLKLQTQIFDSIGMKTKITASSGEGGKVTIYFESDSDLHSIGELLNGTTKNS